MTLRIEIAKSKCKVSTHPPPAASRYLEWRASQGPAFQLREGDPLPPEKLLQAIWFHQRLKRDDLRLADGRPLKVLHPGFWNHGPGPDFKRALLQFGSETPLAGEIEIDLVPSGWRAHGHAQNPDYANVILRIVWEGAAETGIPCLALKPWLDAPMSELADWLQGEKLPALPGELLGRCCAPLRDLGEPQLESLLHAAGLARLQRKALDLQARSRQAGWDQALWEGLFRALGYVPNIWPMLRLGELRPVLQGLHPPDTLRWTALLLGAGNLLPSGTANVRANGHFRELWDVWWRLRAACEEHQLPRSLWSYRGVRPANHPQRRVALAAAWCAESQFIPGIEKWFLAGTGEPDLEGLSHLLQPATDPFWQTHYTLGGKEVASVPLLGAARLTDLAINVILPWFWIRAGEGGNEMLQARAESRYFAWPRAQDNAVERLARERLLGGRKTRLLHSAANQQGLLQIVRDFCDRSDVLCSGCRFPELVRDWTAA